MLADWTVECGAEDPVLVVPWSSGAEDAVASEFVDLRENPYDLEQVSEACDHPPLMQALRALNASRSPVFSAKCDAWGMSADEVETLRVELDVGVGEAPEGFASYIDLVWRERGVFASFHRHVQMLHRLARHAAPLDHPLARLECVLRPAMIDFAGAQEGFAISVYVQALGPDRRTAWEQWAGALEAVAGVLRSKDIALTQSGAGREGWGREAAKLPLQ